MTEYSVGDRVLVPGVVERDDGGVGIFGVQLSSGRMSYFKDVDLRPDTGGRDLTALIPSIERALFGTTDVDLLDDDADLPVGELRRLLREVWASPSDIPGGRDLTAQDVADTQDTWSGGTAAEYRQFAADRLNRIARGDAGSAGDAAALPADPLDLAEKLTAVLDHLIDQVVQDVGDLPTVRNRAAIELAKVAAEHQPVAPRSAGDTGNDNPLLTLDELVEAVELALGSSAIEVDVWETHVAETGGQWRTDRTGESTNPLYRLTRCLRSAGLLDERRDDDVGDDTSELAALRDAESTIRVCRQEIEDQTARAERAEVEVHRIRTAVQRVVDAAQSVVTEASNLGGLDEGELHRRTEVLVAALAGWRSAAGTPTTDEEAGR